MKLHKLGQLFALPLQSAVRAQNLAFQETISFIEQFGTEGGMAKNLQIKTERMVEEKVINQKTGIPETKFKVQPFEISIPLLALVRPPNMQLQEMNVEFGVEIVEIRDEPIKSSTIPSTVLGNSLSSSLSLFSESSQSNPTTMKVSMKIVQEIPEGMARVGDILVDLLSGRAIEEAPPEEGREERPPSHAPEVVEIRHIGPARADILKRKGIVTIKDFLEASETVGQKKELARTLRVSPKRIEEWRTAARLLRRRWLA